MLKKIALLFLVLGLANVAATERNFEQVLNIQGDLRFSVENHKGNIVIKTTPGDQLEIRARIYSEELSAEDLDKLKVIVNQGKGYVNVDVDYDSFHESFSGLIRGRNETPFVDFDILLPDRASLEVESHKADFQIQAPAGKVELETHKGNGHIKGVRNDLEIETHKGNIKVEILEMGDIEVETHKGNVSFVIHDEPNFKVRGESHKGHFSFSGVNVPIQNDDGEMSVSHVAGSGQHDIELETHKGNISFEFVN